MRCGVINDDNDNAFMEQLIAREMCRTRVFGSLHGDMQLQADRANGDRQVILLPHTKHDALDQNLP